MNTSLDTQTDSSVPVQVTEEAMPQNPLTNSELPAVESSAEAIPVIQYPGVEDEEQMAEFRRMVGLPDRAELFQLTRPDDVAEHEWNEELATKLAQTAYQYGVPPQAMAALQDTMLHAYRDADARINDAKAQTEAETERILQQEWGVNYQRNMNRATATLRNLASEHGLDADALLDNPAVGSDINVIKLLYAVSTLVDEAPLHQSQSFSAGAADEAHRIESDPTHPLHEAYMKVNHPNHKYANEFYDRLMRR